LGGRDLSIGKDDQATYAADVFFLYPHAADRNFNVTWLISGDFLRPGDRLLHAKRNVGPITIIAQATPEKAAQTTAAIYKEILILTIGLFTDEQLESAKALLEQKICIRVKKLSDYIFTRSVSGGGRRVSIILEISREPSADHAVGHQPLCQHLYINKPHVGLAIMSERFGCDSAPDY